MIRPLRNATVAVLALCALMLAVPVSASASTVMEYQLQYEPATDYSLLIVTAVGDPQLPLPITVSVPVPAGATVLWAGEVLGGDPAADLVRETQKETVGDMDVYTVTLEQAYTAQIELQLPPASSSGSRTTGTLSWTNPGDEVPVGASVIMPAGATDVELSPAPTGETSTNEAGATLYPLTGTRLAQGAAIVIDASWGFGAASAEDATGSPALPLLLGLLVVAVVALVVAVVRERTRVRRAAEPVGH
jgi:hypothetical protein